MERQPRLIVITGPTGSGKSDLAIELAGFLKCDIISADSRQIYRHIPIGTATPTAEQLATVRHHFIGVLELDQYYSAAQFESDVMELLPRLWEKNRDVVMAGGSMMYIDAVTRGIDDLPTITPDIRKTATEIYNRGGLQQLRLELLERDPVYYREADLNNPKRLIHAIEICLQSGVPYSSLRTGTIKQRPFKTVMMAVDWPREILFDRINRRTEAMIDAGLADEARAVSHLRHLNSLNTVGYKEMFEYLDGKTDLITATARIAKNTRVYAKKQLTWMKQRPSIHLLDPTLPLARQALEILDDE